MNITLYIVPKVHSRKQGQAGWDRRFASPDAAGESPAPPRPCPDSNSWHKEPVGARHFHVHTQDFRAAMRKHAGCLVGASACLRTVALSHSDFSIRTAVALNSEVPDF